MVTNAVVTKSKYCSRLGGHHGNALQVIHVEDWNVAQYKYVARAVDSDGKCTENTENYIKDQAMIAPVVVKL